MQDFTRIIEKLVRAKECIANLDAEIASFIEKGDYPILPESDHGLLLKAIQYHKNRIVPPRFSVLAGEIVHHLRSCFDHIAWHFSVGPAKNPRQIEFPVFEKPLDNKSRERFERKIEGVTNPMVRSLIEQVQPHNATDPLDSPLWVIHSLDIIDKHKELLVCIGTGARFFPPEMQSIVKSYQQQHPEIDPAQVVNHFKGHGFLAPYISFQNFGRRKVQPIIPGLIDLFNYTIGVVEEFKRI